MRQTDPIIIGLRQRMDFPDEFGAFDFGLGERDLACRGPLGDGVEFSEAAGRFLRCFLEHLLHDDGARVPGDLPRPCRESDEHSRDDKDNLSGLRADEPAAKSKKHEAAHSFLPLR